MSHTIPIGVPDFDKAVIICNGDFSGIAHLRMWRSIDGCETRSPDVDMDLPHGVIVGIVKAYILYRAAPLVETWLPKLLDRVMR